MLEPLKIPFFCAGIFGNFNFLIKKFRQDAFNPRKLLMIVGKARNEEYCFL